MLMNIDAADPRPVFRQIVDEVQRCVAVGVFKPADPLPAVRTLRRNWAINANTVQHAYRTLEQEGTVTVRRGLGTFVAAVRGPATPAAGSRRWRGRLPRRCFARRISHGLLASDLMAALQEIAPARGDRPPQVRAVRNRYDAADATRMLGAQPASAGESSPPLPTATKALITIQ